MKRKIGAFFGCFNPIHNGHLAMAEEIINTTDISEIAFVLSYDCYFKNNGKDHKNNFNERWNMVNRALEQYNGTMRPCGTEQGICIDGGIPYTYKVLKEISRIYSYMDVCLIIGQTIFKY